MLRRKLAIALSVWTAAAGLGQADGALPDTGEAFATVGDAYLLPWQATGTPAGQGLAGLLKVAEKPQLRTEPVWDFQREHVPVSFPRADPSPVTEPLSAALADLLEAADSVDARAQALDAAEELLLVHLPILADDPPAPAPPAAEPAAVVVAPAALGPGEPVADARLPSTLAAEAVLPDERASASRAGAAGAMPGKEDPGLDLGALPGPVWLAGFDVPAAFAMFGLLLLLPPLYHRLQRRALLEHAVRGKLYQLVQARPGIHIEELARGAGCSRSTAVYHLRLLAKHGHVVAMDTRKTVHYYPNDGRLENGERERRALLASPRTRAVAHWIVARPGITRTDLASAAGVAVSTLSWHLGRLAAMGLIEERMVDARQRGLYPCAGLPDMMRPWEAQVPAPLPAEPVAAPQAASPAPPAAAPASASLF